MRNWAPTLVTWPRKKRSPLPSGSPSGGRLGPFAERQLDPLNRERGLAAMVRAGHRFALARAIIDLNPGENPDLETA